MSRKWLCILLTASDGQVLCNLYLSLYWCCSIKMVSAWVLHGKFLLSLCNPVPHKHFSLFIYSCWSCCLWKLGSSTGSQGKHSKDSPTGDCGVARIIQVQLCPLVSRVPSPSVLPWKKSNRVLSKAKTKASVQSFCFILKLSPSEPTRSAVGPHGC